MFNIFDDIFISFNEQLYQMKVGNNIKKLRELKNYTQQYMAECLNLSIASYGRIERDETELTLNRLEQIATILETNLSNVLNFDSHHVFNQQNQGTVNATYGIIQHQQVNKDESIINQIQKINEELSFLKEKIFKMEHKNEMV